MLVRRLRRRPNIEPALGQRLVFAGYSRLFSVTLRSHLKVNRNILILLNI